MKRLGRLIFIGFALCGLVLFLSLTTLVSKAAWFGSEVGSGADAVEVVPLTGVIMESKSFLEDMDEALKKTSTKAIVVRINSPGGLVGPSEEIYESILNADKKVPVLVSMGSVAASGGYYAALGGRKIYANAGTLTGSIGVIMELADVSKLLEWAKISKVTLKSGKFKDVGSSSRKMLPEEKALLQGVLDSIFNQFRSVVASRRGLTEAELSNTADGRILTGLQARESKLIDGIAGIEQVIKDAKTLAELPDDAPVNYPVEKTGLLKLLLEGEVSSQKSLLEMTVSELLEEAQKSLSSLTTPGARFLYLAPLGTK